MLSLTKIEERHHGSLLILRWISLEDLGDDCFILRRELEGDAGVVLGGVSVLLQSVSWGLKDGRTAALELYMSP